MKHSLLVVAAAITLPLCASGSALAQANSIKLGISNVDPNSSASAVRGQFTPPDSLSLEVRKKSTLFFSYARALDDHWELEAALGAPPTHDVAIVILNPALPASAVAANGQVGAKVRQVAPTVFANYQFGDKSSQFRPFVGLGINYTVFDKTESTAANDALNGGPTSIRLDDSVGLALQVGLNVKLTDQWSLSGSWATAQVKSLLTTNTLGQLRYSDITFHPSVLTVALGYRF